MDNSLLEVFQSGRYWYIAFPDTTRNYYDTRHPPVQGPETQQLFIWSPVDQTILISSPKTLIEKEVKGGAFTVVDLKVEPVVERINISVRNIFKVTAPTPVIIYCYMATRFGGEAWAPLPVEAWGTEYYAAALPAETVYDIIPCQECGDNNYGRAKKCAPSQILVVAAFDETSVSIRATGALEGLPSGSVSLDAGEAYLVESTCDTTGGPQPDLAGSRITASKPVGVISGNTRAMVRQHDSGLARNSFKNLHVEWLAPVEQHGTEFVYMPTWDQYRQNSDTAARLFESVRLYGTTDGENTEVRINSQPDAEFQVAGGEYALDTIQEAAARYFRTDIPAQAMMNSQAVVIYRGLTGSGSLLGSAYDAEASYMTELTPREQWPNIAPFFVPTVFPQMRHYVNVVTDTAHASEIYYSEGSQEEQSFLFNRERIPGTDLIWGTMEVQPGMEYMLKGRNGARFSGYSYGLWKGYENWVPGRSRKEDRPGIAGGGEDEHEAVLHPSDYYEGTAIAYGYPLAPNRRFLKEGDSLEIDLTGCNPLRIRIRFHNDNPSGIRSLVLDEDSQNSRLTYLTPDDPSTLPGWSGTIVVEIEPVDSRKSARGTVQVIDRTGKITQIPFLVPTGQIQTTPADKLWFGRVELDAESDEQSLVLRNSTDLTLAISELTLLKDSSPFRITRTEPAALPDSLRAGDSITVWLTIRTGTSKQNYSDTLLFRLECVTTKIPVLATTETPCSDIESLHFGRLKLGTPSELAFQICNDGGDTLHFQPSTGDAVFTWSDPIFSIDPLDLARLADEPLPPGECTSVTVTCRATDTGSFRVTARLWSDDAECDSLSQWVARVLDTATTGIVEHQVAGYGVRRSDPNPFSESSTVEFQVGRSGQATVEVYDASGRLIATLLDKDVEAGVHRVRWEAGMHASGLYFCRLRSGAWSATVPLVLAR